MWDSGLDPGLETKDINENLQVCWLDHTIVSLLIS